MVLGVAVISPLLFLPATAIVLIVGMALNDLLVGGVDPSPLLVAAVLTVVAVMSVGATCFLSWKINDFVYANDDYV